MKRTQSHGPIIANRKTSQPSGRSRGFDYVLFRGLTIAAAGICGYGLSWLLGTPDRQATAAPPPAPVSAKPETEPELPAKEEPAKSDTAKNDTAKNEKAKNITFDTIKFDMEKTDPYDRELIGPKIEALTGKKIRIRGFVHPSSSFTQTMRNFILVRDNQECCFGPGAALFDCIIVKMKPGTTAQYTTSPITVEGVFRIEELADPFDEEANPQAIYQMEAEAAR